MMSLRIYRLLWAAVLAAVFCGCKPHSQPQSPSYATEFTTAYLEDFGAYYAEEGLPSRVFAIDLYSEGLSLNKKGLIEGTGTNLCFSDVFVNEEEKSLSSGTYDSSESGEPFTFLPGKHFEGQITGAYLLRIADGSIAEMTILPRGTLTLSYDGPEVILHFEGVTYDKRAYSADFIGVFAKKSIWNRVRSIRNITRF